MKTIWMRSTFVAALSALTMTLGCPADPPEPDAGPSPEAEPDPEPSDGGGQPEPEPTDGGGQPEPEPTDGGGNPEPDPEPSQEPAVVTGCDDGLTDGVDPGADVCEVTAGTGAGTLIVGDVLTPGEVFEGSQVLLDGNGEITCVGCGCAAQATNATQVICPDAVVSPGLINAHDHLGWMGSAPYQDLDANADLNDDERWEHRHDWRRGSRGHDRINSGPSGASNDAKALGAIRFALGGGTAVFGSGSVSFMRDLDDFSPGNIPGVNLPHAKYETFPLDDTGGTLRVGNCNYGDIDQPGIGDGFSAYVPHVSEGIDAQARNEFLCLTGQIEGGPDTLDGNSSIIHGVGLLPADVALMAQRGIGLVWTPRSNISLYGDTAQVTMMHQRGVQIGLGTDWMPSGSMSMLRELKCIDDFNAENLQGYFSDESLWRMATLGSAATLGMDSRLGVLATGHVGDVAIFAKNGRDAYRAVIEANPGDVALVLKGGEVLNGNSAVVDALETGCDEIADVCGSAKRVCAQRETGSTLSALESSANLPYPLFECETPRNEPTCLPARTLDGDRVDGSNNYEGVSRADDSDGDGILDADDNCPTVFNPIRPLDNGEQGDADGDDLGDVCDPCPLDADTEDCTTFNPNDSDGDGVDNLDDNCPMIANDQQEDGDTDGKGDVCDPCPMFSNPGDAGCPASVEDIKTADIIGDRVSIDGDLVVTAVAYNGFWAQLDQDTPMPFSGFFVYEPASENLPTQGAVIQISGGTVADFFDQRQLSSVTWVDQGTTKELPAVVLDAAAQGQAVTDGGASGYEGMLVQLDNAEVTNAMPTAGPGDDGVNELELTTGVRVDDFLFPRVDGMATVFLDPFPEAGFTFSSVSGILSMRNSFMKVGPRDSDDMLLGPPALRHFTPEGPLYTRAGATGTLDGTVANPQLTIVLTSDAEDAPITIELVSGNDAILTVPATVEIAAGTREVAIPVTGVAVGTTSITANIQGETDTLSVDVEVLDPAAIPDVVSIDPDATTLLINDVQTYTVTLSHPAPEGGQEVTVALTGGVGTADATFTVQADLITGTFDVTAAAAAATGTVEASIGGSTASASLEVVDTPPGTLVINEVDYDQPGGDSGEFVELYNGGPEVDLTGYRLVLINGNNGDQYATETLSGTLATGGFHVVTYPSNGIQNGAPDAVALVNAANELVDAISYEGDVGLVDFGNGDVSLISGTAASAVDMGEGSLCRLADGVDTGDDDADWGICPTITEGMANVAP